MSSSLTLEERIQRLEDIEAIKGLQADYAAACDDHYNPDSMIELFTRNGVWDGSRAGLPTVTGSDALHAHFTSTQSLFLWAFHLMIAPKIEIVEIGRRATGSWYLLEAATLQTDGGPEPTWIGSVYDIDYTVEDGKWRFERMAIEARLWASHAQGWGSDGRGA